MDFLLRYFLFFSTRMPPNDSEWPKKRVINQTDQKGKEDISIQENKYFEGKKEMVNSGSLAD